MKTKKQEITSRIEFRWRQHEEQFAQLLVDSARENGRSESDEARELLKAALGESDQLQHALATLQGEVTQLHEQLKQLSHVKSGLRTVHENIYQLRDDLATCVAKLLVNAGTLDDAAAEAWVKQALDAN